MSERLDSQDPALSLLGKVLGYTCMRGSELGHERDSEAEPWLTRRLEAALRRINPGLSEQGAKQAMASLRQPVGSGLLEANEASHSLLSRWVSVEEAAPAPGQPPMRRSVKFFDFENPTNNDFLAVDEFAVRGSQGVSRFDIVLFVNGLPLILIDEAHRSEYGVFNARLRQALPHAGLIAFTGTPIPKTVAKFGSYIHKYTMPQSVEDEATVPILYESRLPQLAVWGKRLDPLFEAEFPDLSDEQKEEIKKLEVTARKIAEAPERIEMIALDIAKHYQENFEPDGFKAQVAACSQRAAAAYYETLSRLLPNRVALLLSDPAKDQKDLWELKKQFADEEEIIRQFTDDGVDQLAIIIVVDKYLTGFDAPIERVLYLDKSLQEHNLLQAIARVNRPLPEKDKQWGLVVDYWGVANFLDRALKGLHEDLDPGEVMARRDDDTAHSALRGRRSDVYALFPADLKRSDITPWLEALEPEDQRALFLARYRSFYKALEQLLPDPRALAFLADFAWLRKIRLELQTFFEEEDLSLPDCSERVRRLIEKSIQGDEIIPLLKPISILSKDFDKELEKLTSDRSKALRMRHAIKHTLTVKLHQDPVYYETLQERLQRIIAERTASRFDDIAEFKLLTDLAEEMRERNEAERNNDVSAELAPFFNAISKAMNGEADGTCVAETPGTDNDFAEIAAKILDALREQAVIDWRKKAEIQRDMRRAIKRQLRMHYFIDRSQIDHLTATLMDLARVHLDE